MPDRPSRLKKGTAVAVLAVTVVASFEGLRRTAYPDPATGGKPWTICYGHTVGVNWGDQKTLQECKSLLLSDLEIYSRGILNCTTVYLPDERFVALTSFAYNVGVGAACRSSVVGLINQGRIREGCDALMKWNRAAGIVFPGLTKRRAKERELCLRGLP